MDEDKLHIPPPMQEELQHQAPLVSSLDLTGDSRIAFFESEISHSPESCRHDIEYVLSFNATNCQSHTRRFTSFTSEQHDATRHAAAHHFLYQLLGAA